MTSGPVFVRHGVAIPLDDGPAADWPLDPSHLDDVRHLVDRVPPRSIIVASDYRRALDTAAALGNPRPDLRLREVERPRVEHIERATVSYLGGERLTGWEPQEEVVARMAAVVDDFGADAVYVGHGTALTLYFAHAIPGLAAYEFWMQLRNPDVWQLGAGLTRL